MGLVASTLTRDLPQGTRDLLMQMKCSYWLSRLTTTSLGDKKYPRKYTKLLQCIAPKCGEDYAT